MKWACVLAMTLSFVHPYGWSQANSAKVSPWLAKQNERLVNEIKALKQQEASLQEAIAQAGTAQTYARDQRDSAAEAVATRALAEGKQGLSAVQSKLARTVAAQQAFRRALQWQLHGASVVAVPAAFSGTVLRRDANGAFRPFDPTSPVRMGDV